MILKNRLFQREEPNREAKSIYIFCEGIRRESDYFQYFKELDSRINIEIYPLKSDEDNSPTGLYVKAYESLVKSDENPNPKYEFIESLDEVWFVIDTDLWKDKISELREKCKKHDDWQIAQSNPCFEVWLYFHFESKIPIELPSNWKTFLNETVAGGFDSRKHPIYIENAIENSEKNYSESHKNEPEICCTQVFTLGKSIFSLTKEKLKEGIKKLPKK